MYWHRYIAKTILPTPENKVNSLYGSVIGTIFELFYVDRVYLQQGVQGILEARLDAVLDDVVARESKNGAVLWDDPKSNYKSREALRKDVLKSIPRGIGIIRHHRLVGQPADAEVKLDSMIDGHMIGGRADFIMRRVNPCGDLVILDGKGSRHRDKYVDPQQLWWYAMLYREQHKHTPDKLGFVFWRQEPETSLDWVPFSPKSLDDLLAGVLSDVRAIEANKTELARVPESPEQLAALSELFPLHLGDKCTLC